MDQKRTDTSWGTVGHSRGTIWGTGEKRWSKSQGVPPATRTRIQTVARRQMSIRTICYTSRCAVTECSRSDRVFVVYIHHWTLVAVTCVVVVEQAAERRRPVLRSDRSHGIDVGRSGVADRLLDFETRALDRVRR